MLKHTKTPALLLPLLWLGTAGCLDGPGQSNEPDELAQSQSAIVNGTPMASANTGHVWLGNCSGELLRNSWVITARHCVVDYFLPGRSISELRVRTSGSTSDGGTNADQIILHPEGGLGEGARLDIALVHLNAPIAVNGDYVNFRRDLYTGSLTSLNGKTLDVFGYSATSEGATDHDLHTARMVASQAQAETAAVQWIDLAKNAAGQYVWHGDSGGGSYYNGQLVGINCCLSSDGGWQTALNGLRGWILNRVGGSTGLQGQLAWEPITAAGPGAFATPQLVVLGDRRIRAFTVSGTLAYYGSYDGATDPSWHWLDFGLPGGVGTTAITALSWGGNRLDVISRGTDARLYHCYSSTGGSSWSTWESLGGPTTSAAPEAVSWAAGRIDVFAATGTGQLAHWWTSNSPWGSETLAGSATGKVSAVALGAGRLQVFARGSAGQLSHWYYPAGAGFGYESLGGTLAAAPRVVTSGGSRLEVLAVDSAAQLRRFSYSDATGWAPVQNLGGAFKAQQPGAVSWGTNRVDVFVAQQNGSIAHTFSNGGSFFAFEDWGSSASEVSVASAGVNSLYIFHGGTYLTTRLYY